MIKFLLDCIGSFLMWLFILILLACASLSYLQKHPACDHSWGFSSKAELNCWQSEITYKCYKCDETKTEQINNVDNHDYIVTIVKESTCTELGKSRSECRVCGYAKEDYLTTKSHVGDFKVTKKAGVFTEGEETGTCTICGNKVTLTIWPYGTSEDEPYVTKANDFYREAIKEGGEDKFKYEWVQLSGTIKAIDQNSKYDSTCYLFNDNNKKLVCSFTWQPTENYTVGDSVKITGYVRSIKKNVIELDYCSFSNALTEGDTGAEVTKLKKRMQELGYFTEGASLSNTYNSITTERIKMFQEANGLRPTGDANEATLQRLYSAQAIKNPNKL